MARPRRADEAGGIYHALKRGNRRATIFRSDEDYWAFENILSEGAARNFCNPGRLSDHMTGCNESTHRYRKASWKLSVNAPSADNPLAVQRLGLQTTMRPKGRPRKSTDSIKET